MKTFLFLIILSMLLSSFTLTGKIVKVQDGDTVTLLDNNNTQHKIRLHGIDAPETGQPYGNKSKEHLSGLIADKNVTVDVKGKDQYKRILGVIYLGDTNINAEMIRSGYAWSYKYSKDKYYIKLQEKAKEQKKGLWKDKNAVDPWQWRKNKKKRIYLQNEVSYSGK
ncbi:MAG: thermonuclease family protein [Dysgonomonas sp.]